MQNGYRVYSLRQHPAANSVGIQDDTATGMCQRLQAAARRLDGANFIDVERSRRMMQPAPRDVCSGLPPSLPR